jgi:hypothetical protein
MEKGDALKENRRSVKGPDGEMYYVNTPTAEDIRGADWNYSKVYSKALNENIVTASEMSNILTKRGIIGPEYEQRQQELIGLIGQKIYQLNMVSNDDEKKLLAIELANTRDELYKWNQRFNGPMSNTCEQIADDARLEYLTAAMFEYEDGNRVWSTYEEYKAEK